MAIVVNNPSETREVREVREVDNGSDAASWVLAIAVIIILALGAYYLLPRLAYRGSAPQAPSTNVQVTLPTNSSNPAAPAGGNAGGNTSPNVESTGNPVQ